tara:strand:- start:27794 stop:28186 length:393 start_codon:yes stop_codon:yes gene_type:complete
LRRPALDEMPFRYGLLALTMKKVIRAAKHLQFIRSQPCIITGQKAQACHIRILTDGGTGIKPSDFFCIGLHQDLHRQQHILGEQSFYKKWEINPFTIAKDLVIMSDCKKVNTPEIIRLLEERAMIYGGLC